MNFTLNFFALDNDFSKLLKFEGGFPAGIITVNSQT